MLDLRDTWFACGTHTTTCDDSSIGYALGAYCRNVANSAPDLCRIFTLDFHSENGLMGGHEKLELCRICAEFAVDLTPCQKSSANRHKHRKKF